MPAMPAASAATAARVGVVVLNWNGWQDTLECLAALARSTGPPTVLVVDNGSTDGSEEELRRARPDLTILQTGANLGYAGGNNAGVRRLLADGVDHVWVLNNDARPRPDALAALLAASEPGIGILASRVVPPTLATAVRGEELLLCGGCAAGYHDADRVLGASLLISADLIRDVGYFDERYFHYAEEEDLAMRARRAGWRVGLACRSVIDHAGGSSLPVWSPQASYYDIRNVILFERRFYERRAPAVLLRHRRRLRARFALGTSLRRRDARRLVAVCLGIVDGARGRGGPRDLGPRYAEP
jgi:GT2 family glycosyltransferase